MEGQDEMELQGGQIWKQQDMPNFTVYLTLLGDGKLAMLTPPDQYGSLTRCLGPKQWAFTVEELTDFLQKHKYTCMGQYKDILKKELEDAYNQIPFQFPGTR